MNLNLSQKWQTLDLIWFAYIQTGVMAHMKIKCCPPPCQTQTASNFTDKKRGYVWGDKTTRICVETAVSEVWKHTNERWILQLALPFVVEVCSELRPTFEKILTPPESNKTGRVEKRRESEPDLITCYPLTPT